MTWEDEMNEQAYELALFFHAEEEVLIADYKAHKIRQPEYYRQLRALRQAWDWNMSERTKCFCGCEIEEGKTKEALLELYELIEWQHEVSK